MTVILSALVIAITGPLGHARWNGTNPNHDAPYTDCVSVNILNLLLFDFCYLDRTHCHLIIWDVFW